MATKIQPEQIAQGGALDGNALVWNTSLDMWIPDTVSGAGYGTIQEEGTPLTPRNVLNFVGSGFTAADDTTRTNVTLNTFLNTLATSGSVSLTAHVSGLLPFANIADLGALSVLGRASNSSGVMAAISASTDNQVLRRSGTSIGFGSINLASADAVTGDLPFSNIAQIATDRLLGRDTACTGDIESLTVGGGIEFTGTGGIQTSAFTGDATKTAGGTALTLATVNSNVGSFGSATQVATFTVNGKGLITAASNTTISIPSTQVSDFTEAVQDVIGGISVDSNTLDWTYNDPSNQLTAEVKTQMSLTSDASGIKLSGDSASPGNSQYYGTNGSGVKGYYALPGGGGTPGGSNTQLQYNNSGVFGGITGATTDGTSVTLNSPKLTGSGGGNITLSYTPAANRTYSLPDVGADAIFVLSEGAQTIAGVKSFSSNILALGGISTDTTATNSNLTASTTTAVSTANSQHQIGGATTTFYRTAVRGSTNTTLTAGTSYASLLLGENLITEATSGTHPLIANVAIRRVNITNGTAATTDAATLYIESAPAGTASPTNSYALFVDAGLSRFDGNVQIGSYTLPTADGGSNQVLTTNGSGVVSWATPSGGGSSSGATGSIQFSNGSGGFSSDTSNLFWDDTNNMLEIAGNTGSNYGILMTGTGYGISIAPPGTQTGALNAVNVVGDYTGLITNNITNTNTTTGGAKLQLSVATSSTGDPYVAMTVGDQNYVFGIDNSDANNIFVIGQGTSPSGITTPNFALNGFLTGVGGVTNPTSKLHLPAGTATANTSPLKFTSGTALTTPEDGAVEYHGSHLYFTIGSTRYQLDQQSGGSTSWADLTSGTQTGSLTATLATNETFAMNYAGGNFAFYADDATSTFKAFSKDQTQYVEVNNTDVRIGSGTFRMQYIDGVLRLYDSDQTHYVGITVPNTGALTSNLNLILPNNTGSSNNILRTDGAGTLSWVDITTLGVGDVTGPVSSSTDGIVLFSDTGGNNIKQATGSGIVTSTSGVYGTTTAPAGDIVGTTDTQTLTNKRINPRETKVASNTTPAPDVSTTDMYVITALAGNCTLGAPTGTPVQGTKLIYRIKDSGTARTLAYNAIYRAMGVTLPTTTVISKTLYLACIYNFDDTKWDIVAVNMEA